MMIDDGEMWGLLRVKKTHESSYERGCPGGGSFLTI